MNVRVRDLDNAVHAKIKIEAIRQGITIDQMVANILTNFAKSIKD